MPKVVTIIMAGGQGKRLYPLTKVRSKAAVPIAGKFRLIDIPISNCIHSDLRKIFILTQFSSESLHRHIFLTYRFDNFSKDFLTILSAQQTLDNRNWYQGTADSVRQNLHFFEGKGDVALILAGDHLYRMDYRKFIDSHLEKNAEISIAVTPISSNLAKEFGVMKVNQNVRITDFCEKPNEPDQVESMRISDKILNQFEIDPTDKTHFASMGIYIFNWDILHNLLINNTFEDFGREVIPYAIKQHNVYGYFFNGYWEDIGTIESFFEAHINLTEPLPKFNFYDEEKPIFSHARFLPGSKILSSKVHDSILCEGSIINSSNIGHSIIGIRSRIGANSSIERTIMMGADYFESKNEMAQNERAGIPNIGIGKDCEIRNAIIDKNARIGNNVRLINSSNAGNKSTENYAIVNRIIVIPKNAIISDRTVI